MNYFIEFYKNVKRLGPGCDEETKRAFDMLEDLPENPKILDVGCGNGKQTITLAKLIDCEITAVDFYDSFLDELREKIVEEYLFDKIIPINASMLDLPFGENEYDLIWSEGAVYIMGFSNGLREWKKFLKPGGYLVVSEISWLREDIPGEMKKFWDDAYKEMDTIPNKIKVIENEGYELINHFTLPEECWIDDYYLPLMENKNNYLEKFGYADEALKVVKELEEEFEMYMRYKDYYGYEFYLMKKK